MKGKITGLLLILIILAVVSSTGGIFGSKEMKKQVIVLKKPGMTDEVKSESLPVPVQPEESLDISEDSLLVKPSRMSGEVVPVVNYSELEELKNTDYDRYLEEIGKRSGMPKFTGVMVSNVNKRIRDLLKDVRDALRNSGEASLKRYTQRLNSEIIRHLSRQRIDESRAMEFSDFIQREIRKSFVTETEKKWAAEYLRTLVNLIRNTDVITPFGKAALKNFAEK